MKGPTVAITTDEGSAGRVSALFRIKGLEPVPLPCIGVEAAPDIVCDRAREAAASADLLIVTSARTIGVLWPDGGMPGVPVAAVGPATARAVREAGGVVAVEGRGGSQALVEALGTVRGRVVVFPHAAGASAHTAERLAARGAVVDAHSVYRTRPIPPGDASVDSVAFASPSAVEGWLLARSLDGLIVASVGETTASYLEGRGHRSDVVPTRPTFPSLADALAGRMIERSTG